MNERTLAAIMFIGYFAVLILAIYITKSPWCLLILLFVQPSYSSSDDKDKEK